MRMKCINCNREGYFHNELVEYAYGLKDILIFDICPFCGQKRSVLAGKYAIKYLVDRYGEDIPKKKVRAIFSDVFVKESEYVTVISFLEEKQLHKEYALASHVTGAERRRRLYNAQQKMRRFLKLDNKTFQKIDEIYQIGYGLIDPVDRHDLLKMGREYWDYIKKYFNQPVTLAFFCKVFCQLHFIAECLRKKYSRKIFINIHF